MKAQKLRLIGTRKRMLNQRCNMTHSDTRSILLLEDDEPFALILQEFLELYSCKVTRVTDGVEGLRKIVASDFDLILCDMVMPTFPGDKFYIAVERVKPILCKRFIFMTGHQADPKWDAFIREVRGLMLWKPFQMHDLLIAMRTVFRRSRLLELHKQYRAFVRTFAPHPDPTE
jgi:DNA-binding response OmpR family regulator